LDVATLTVRDLADDVYAGLKLVAASRGRSMEAEARDILTRAVDRSTWVNRWIEATADWRGELELPPRSAPRDVEWPE
jgi:plasmid stability protein